jgi:hypothetical protein
MASWSSCSNAAKAGKERCGLKSSIYPTIRCVVMATLSLARRPAPSFACLAKNPVQPRLGIGQVFALVQRRQMQGNPARWIADGPPNGHLIEEEPCLLHPDWNDRDPYRGQAALEHRRSYRRLYLITPDFARFILGVSMDE